MAFKIFLMSATLRLRAGQTNVIYFQKKGDIEMFKFMNRRPHVYLLRSDKYPNNVKISHSSLMNLCKTFCAPGQYFFRQEFHFARGGGGGERGGGGGVAGRGGGGRGGPKARIFMPGKHANYAKRVIPSWAGSQNSESAPRPAPPPPRWQCHWITMRGLPLRDAPSSLQPARRPAPLLPTPAHLENPLAAGQLLGFQSRSRRCELGGPAAEVTCHRQTTGRTAPEAGQRSHSRRGERTQPDPGGPGREPRRCWFPHTVTNAQPVPSLSLLMLIILIIAATVESSGQRGKNTVLCGHLVPISCEEGNGSRRLLRL